MSNILTLALKDLRILWRDKAGLFWVFGFPILMAILFGLITSGMGGGARKMRIAVEDQDGSEGSRAFLVKLKNSPAVDVRPIPPAEAREAVRKGNLVAFVVIPKGFGETSLFSGSQGPAIEVGIDPARTAEAGYLQGILAEASVASMSQAFSNPSRMREQLNRARGEIAGLSQMSPAEKERLERFLAETDRFYGSGSEGTANTPQFAGPNIKQVPVTRDQVSPKSSFEITFPQGIIWGLLGTAATFSLSFVRERTGGTLLRLRVAPLSRAQILAGKGLACFLACAMVTVVLLALGAIAFGVRFKNPLLALAIACTCGCFVGIMMLLSVLGKSEAAVSGSGWGVLIIMSMFGGGMIPLIAMPGWMQTAGSISPVKWAVLSLEGAIWRGFTLTEMLLPCSILLGVGALTFAIGVTVLALAHD